MRTCSLIRMTDQGNGVFKAYSILGLPVNASQNDIKEKFKELALQYHPDKLSPDITDQQRKETSKQFVCIEEAYHLLSDPAARHQYDILSKAELLTQEYPISEEVDLSEMSYDEGDRMYSRTCRCGGHYIITDDDLTSGVDLTCCDMCSLTIRVLFQHNQRFDDNTT